MPKGARAFIDDLSDRVRQLVAADMLDGRVLPKSEAEVFRSALVELVRSEALPQLITRNPGDAIVVLDRLKACGWTDLEAERPRLERERSAKYPPPAVPTWPELRELKSAAAAHPQYCVVRAPVESVYFAEALREAGLALPDELLALHATHDGFDLSHLARPPHVPVFSLLPSAAIDECEASSRYPRRAACFQGGDAVQLSVYRDKKGAWWLVHELEYEPTAKRPLRVQALLGFGLRRMRAATFEELQEGPLSWESYFAATD